MNTIHNINDYNLTKLNYTRTPNKIISLHMANVVSMIMLLSVVRNCTLDH